jgi:hypothetical protein
MHLIAVVIIGFVVGAVAKFSRRSGDQLAGREPFGDPLYYARAVSRWARLPGDGAADALLRLPQNTCKLV